MVRPLYRSVLFTLLLFTLLLIGVSNAGKKTSKTSTTTIPPALSPVQNGPTLQANPTAILNAPERGCPVGQRKDNKGRCRTII